MALGLLSTQLVIMMSRQVAAADYVSLKMASTKGPFASCERISIDPQYVADCLVEAVIQIESGGKSQKVGRAGERGVMQIKHETWKQVTCGLFGRALPFDQAFDPKVNRRVGKAYLAKLQIFLKVNKSRWRSDERSLLLACYNAGPTRVIEAGFNTESLSSSTRSYVERATAMHEYYLAEEATAIRHLLSMPRPP